MSYFVTGWLTSLLVNVGVSLGVVAGLLVWQQGFGAGDTAAFLFWTLLLAMSVAVIGPPLLSLGRKMPVGAGWLPVVGLTVLLTGGWILLVAQLLGPWMGAFSFSVLYPWLAGVAAQLWWLKRLVMRQAIGSFGGRYWLASLGLVVGVPAALVGASFLYEYVNRPTPETYLIPADYRGAFRVVYGEPGGVSPRLENGRRVLQLDSLGVLIIQPEFQAGRIDNKYYLLAATGTRQELSDLPDSSSRLRIDLEGTGTRGSAMPDGSFSSESPLAITYTDFRVSDPHSPPPSDSLRMREGERLDSLTELLVQRCRVRVASATQLRK